jgi:hypothetical protein
VIRNSLAYVLCRIEDDSSLTPVSQHGDFLTGIAAGGHAVEVEDLDRCTRLMDTGRPISFTSSRQANDRLFNHSVHLSRRPP